MSAGGPREESEYIFKQVRAAKIVRPGKKPKFQYHVGPVPVCRAVYLWLLGLSPGNSRVHKYERMVRNGLQYLPPVQTKRRAQPGLTRSDMARAWFREYILKQGEKSPSLKLIEIDAPVNRELHESYEERVAEEERVGKGTFFNLWYEILGEKLFDPVKGIAYDVKFRKRRANGFKACDDCESLKLAVKMATTQVDRDMAVAKKIEHFRSVRRDRDEGARIRLLCSTNKKYVGFAIDGADSHKWPTPTTKSCAKVCDNNKYDISI